MEEINVKTWAKQIREIKINELKRDINDLKECIRLTTSEYAEPVVYIKVCKDKIEILNDKLEILLK